MKLLLFILFTVGVFFYFPYTSLDSDPFEPLQNYEIVIKGEVEKVITMSVEPYTQIKDIVHLLPLNDESDIEALDFNRYITKNQVITIPKKIERVCVSINQATLEQLITLKGIGPNTAQAIMEHREHHPFILLEDLMKVKGIGFKKYETIKDDICL